MKQNTIYNIKLIHICIFLTAAENCSFSRTADMYRVTQPMISKTIQTIEEKLGVDLFSRENGKIIITPKGRELAVQWKKLLTLFEKSVEDIRN